jgi:4-hydroxybenzoate polyprenyltransferase
MRRILSISRPRLWINTLGPAVLGLWSTGQLWHLDALIILLWLTLPFNALIYGVNDVFDIDIDQDTTRKGGWQGAVLERSELGATLRWVVLINTPFLAIFFWNFPTFANVLVWLYTFIFVFYSAPPLRFKARPLIDSLSNAAYALPVAIVPWCLQKNINLWLLVGLMTWSVAKHCYDAIQDRSVDERHGLLTTPVFLGIKASLSFCALFWLLSSLCFYQLSPAIAAINAAYSFLLLIPVGLNPTEKTAERWYPVSVAFPYVVGSVGGVTLALAVLMGWWA